MARGPQDESALLLRFREGDAEAFGEVVRTYSGLVRYVVAGFWRSPFEQEEALQEVWLQAFGQRERLDPARLEQFGAWLSVLARRRCIDLWRRQRRTAAREESQAEPELAAAPPAVDSPAAAAERSELRDAVADFRARLKPGWRDFFEKVFVLGLDSAEAARELGLGRLRAKYLKRALVRRARRSPRLRAALGRLQGGG